MKDDSMTNDLELNPFAAEQPCEQPPAPVSFSELEQQQAAEAPPSPEDLQAVYDVPVKVQAVLGRARMGIGELLRLKTGTVVELDRRVGEAVDIFVNNRLIARGEVVLIDNALGVTLTEIVRQEGA